MSFEKIQTKLNNFHLIKDNDYSINSCSLKKDLIDSCIGFLYNIEDLGFCVPMLDISGSSDITLSWIYDNHSVKLTFFKTDIYCYYFNVQNNEKAEDDININLSIPEELFQALKEISFLITKNENEKQQLLAST